MGKTIAALMVLAAPMAAEAGVRQDSETTMPEDAQTRAFFEDWGFSDAIIAGDTVYLSGFVVGLRRDETDLKAAYVRAFDEIAKVLGRAGVSWDDVVDITTYHTDLTTQMPAITAVKRNYVKAPYPAWTAVQVVRLIPDRGITEIKLIAKRPAKPKR
jgi:enamine deaminase RidA (YjgF/YER057c/UK114 family)